MVPCPSIDKFSLHFLSNVNPPSAWAVDARTRFAQPRIPSYASIRTPLIAVIALREATTATTSR